MKRLRKQCTALTALLLCLAPQLAWGQTAEELQQQIDQHNAQITQLDKDIAEYQKQLSDTSAKKQTLQSVLNDLNLNIKKTTAQISVLQNQIGSTQLQVKQLAGKISTAQDSIGNDSSGLAESVRALQAEEAQPIAIQMLSNGTMADLWNDVSALATIQGAVKAHIDDLASAKRNFTDAKTATEQKQADLLKQQQALRTQQGSLNAQKKSQNDLLAQTKSQESNYQKLIAQKKAQEASFESALTQLKAQYQQALNPSQIPTTGKGILSWPVDTVHITQYFGDTAFAASGAYNGKGHNGIDIGVPIGTPVHAALSGTVIGVGNTDAIHTSLGQCYSFGKWVMIQHANGLSTMYAHFSDNTIVHVGQTVTTGQLIGYSGETGYATGPHLHFGVYVASVTKIIQLGDATNAKTPCATATMPVPTSLSGYLNPLNYLPAVP